MSPKELAFVVEVAAELFVGALVAQDSGAVYNPTHNCPSCGRLQLTVFCFGPGPYHTHQCPVGTLLWYH
jgi:hypothetical protein